MEVIIMKCVKRIDSVDKSEVIRVSDDKANKLVKWTSLWQYTNKKEWKEGGRKR
jgi:hypothetical protein